MTKKKTKFDCHRKITLTDFHNAKQGTINCASLLAGLGGSGDPKWEMGGKISQTRAKNRFFFTKSD